MAERTNEEALDLFADLLEPCAEILADREFTESLTSGEKRVKAVRTAIRNHKSQIIEILAILDGEDPATYKVPNPLTLFKKLMDFLNRDEVKDLFTGQAQKTGGVVSGSATANTEDGAI